MDTLGWIYYKKKLYDSAIEEFKSAIEKSPDNPMFHYHLGIAYNKKWEYTDAEKCITKALELNPDFKEADNARSILATFQ